jgi:GR25 family glycosyltransferase involved in LPS biosynthesis
MAGTLTGPKVPAGWDFFDRVYCISLEHRLDRRERVREEFVRVGLADRVEFVIAHPHAQDRERGIFESHQRCLRRGIRDGAQRILVFEDDVFFGRQGCGRIPDACAHLAQCPGWEAFFLGCLTRSIRPTSSPALRRITYRSLAHAYGLNRPFAEQVVRRTWQGIPYDALLQQMQNEFYALSPMCAFQDRSASDNQTVALDRLRRLCGGLAVIQRGSELYRKHRTLVIAAHLAVLLLLLLVLPW